MSFVCTNCGHKTLFYKKHCPSCNAPWTLTDEAPIGNGANRETMTEDEVRRYMRQTSLCPGCHQKMDSMFEQAESKPRLPSYDHAPGCSYAHIKPVVDSPQEGSE